MPSVASFFRRYSNGYLAFDPNALLSFFDIPCLIVDNVGDHLIAGTTDLLRYLGPPLASYEKNGVQAIEAAMQLEQFLDSDCCCSVRYHVENQHRKMVGDFEYHYVLVSTTDDWRIKFAKIGRVHVWGLKPA